MYDYSSLSGYPNSSERIADTFIGLNGLRILSIIGLLLVFSSNIVTLVHDIQAVNRFQAGKAATSDSASTNTTADDMLNSDYIMHVLPLISMLCLSDRP